MYSKEVNLNWLVIVNEKAGNGNAGKLWANTKSKLLDAKICFTAKFTVAPHQTRLLALNALNQGYNGIIVYGGDGTVSDTAAALSTLEEKPLLAFIPTGSGNDWIKSIGFLSPSIDSSISAIVMGNVKSVDTGLCSWESGSKFFLNSAGIGFDAFVLRNAISIRKFLPLGSSIYLVTMIASALFPPHWRGTISSEGENIYKGDYFSLTIGIGKYSGGGMILAPDAEPDDGLFDGLIISPLNFFTILKCFPKIFNGTLATQKQATAIKGKIIEIEVEANSKSSIILEVDGEIVKLPKNLKKISFSTVQSNLKVIAPNQGNQ